MIRAVLLSRFDDRLGPVIVCSMPKLKEDMLDALSSIPRLMDIIEPGNFLTQTFQDIYTANYYFEMPAQDKRGRTESLLMSIVFRVQVSDEEWIGKITAFLQEQEATLKKFASTFGGDKVLARTSPFNKVNEAHLKHLLYELYTEVFVQNAKELLVEAVVQQHVWVMSPPKYDAIGALERIKKSLEAPPRTIRKELLQFMLSRLKFTLYNCEFRQGRVQDCSICKRRYIESTACMFLFNVDDGDARGELEDALTHLSTLNIGITNPFLVLGINEGERGDDDFTTLIDVSSNMANLWEASTHATQTIVNIGEPDTYYELIKWFLSVIL